MSYSETEFEPFAVKDCALVAIATGSRAQNLRELSQAIAHVHSGSIYYHFWGGLLRPRFDNPEFNNDFAVWAKQGLHDDTLAERLAVIDPTSHPDLESLRAELIDVIEDRLEETEWVSWAKYENQFYFIRSQIVVFDTNTRITEPHELAGVVPSMSVSSVFYHFIDARRRTEQRCDDFRSWLTGFGDAYDELCHELAGLDPHFVSLTKLRKQLSGIFGRHFDGDTEASA